MGGKTEKNRIATTSTAQEENKKEELFTLSQLKEVLKIQEETIMTFFNSTVDRLESKIDTMKKEHDKEINELKKSIEYHGKDVTELNSTVKHEVQNIMTDRKDFVTYINEKMAGQEDRDRRNNLRFENIAEDPDGKETWENCEEKVLSTIKKLGIDPSKIHIERAHRVGGRRVQGRKRGILVKFSYFKQKDNILTEYRKQRYWEKKEVYVNEDFSEYTTNLRKKLFAEARALRERGEYAKVVYNRIVRQRALNAENTMT